MLNQTLSVIPEPTQNLITSWYVQNIYELAFDQPSGIAAEEGDMLVLEPHHILSDTELTTVNTQACSTSYL